MVPAIGFVPELLGPVKLTQEQLDETIRQLEITIKQQAENELRRAYENINIVKERKK